MSDRAQEGAQIAFAVGPDNPSNYEGQGSRTEIPLGLSAAQAGELGRALLAASAVCSSSSAQPEGTRVENCHFPVVKWATARSNNNGLPILIVEVRGGTQLALQFDPKLAAACAESLARAAAITRVKGTA